MCGGGGDFNLQHETQTRQNVWILHTTGNFLCIKSLYSLPTRTFLKQTMISTRSYIYLFRMDEGSKEPKFMFILLPVFCQSFILCFVPHYSFIYLSSFNVIDINIFYQLPYICPLSKDKMGISISLLACF